MILSENINSSTRNKINNFFSAIPDSYLGDLLPVVIVVMPKGISKGETLIFLDQQGVIDINKTMVFLRCGKQYFHVSSVGTNVTVLNPNESWIKIADIKLVGNTEDNIYNFAKSLKL